MALDRGAAHDFRIPTQSSYKQRGPPGPSPSSTRIVSEERGAVGDFPIPTQSMYERLGGAQQLPRPKRPGKLPRKEKPMPPLPSTAKKPPSGAKPQPPSPKAPEAPPPRKPRAPSLKEEKLPPAPPPASPSLPTLKERVSFEKEVPIRRERIEPPIRDLTVSGVETAGLEAAREAQKRIEEQATQITALETEIQRLCEELQYNEEEVARRKRSIRRLESEIQQMQETAVPLDEARTLASEILRKGFALRNITAALTPLSVSQQNLRFAFNQFCFNAFGTEAREVLLARRRSPGLIAEGAPVIDVGPVRLKESMRLLRAEQLFLLEESAKVLSEVQLLQSAVKATPRHAAAIFHRFQRAIRERPVGQMMGHRRPSDDKTTIGTTTTTSTPVLGLCTLDRVISKAIWRILAHAFTHWCQLTSTKRLRPTPRQRRMRRKSRTAAMLALLIRRMVLQRLREAWETLRDLEPDTRIRDRQHPTIMPKELLESVGFALQPWYFDSLPSVVSQRRRHFAAPPPGSCALPVPRR